MYVETDTIGKFKARRAQRRFLLGQIQYNKAVRKYNVKKS